MTVQECLNTNDRHILAAMCGGQVLELNEPAPADAQLHLLTLAHDEGRRIYERSLRFVLLMALRRLYPGQQVRIEYSAGHGVYVRLPGMEVTAACLADIERVMRELVQADLPFEKKTWQLDDAIRYFEEDGQSDKVALLRLRPYSFFRMYCCGGMWEYFYGAMVPSTGYVPAFALEPQPNGFVLMLPTADAPDAPAAYIHRPKHLQVFGQSARWCEILGVVNAADVAELMARKRMRAFIRVNEALHDKAIASIADSIVTGGKRIVLVAGPSSSGKTTFTGRLGVHLQVLGRRAVQISLDNYYRNRSELPREADGTVDLEALHTIDVPLLRTHLAALLRGEEVEVPRFDFVTSSRVAQGVPLRLGEQDIVMLEGIHGLNPALYEGLPMEMIHRVFVSALTCINLDDHNRIRTTDVRLLRRIVRDNQFRGTLPEETLAMWNSVRQGEEKWIFPYQEQADSVFNTALHYELPILKHFASELLEAIPPESPQYLMARRLCKTLHYFPAIDPEILDEIPPLSLLREFIGGSTMEKE
ncbi:MAG: nucleoside kinase [Clostridia bacterium]|nr:nucleoside kinase [Clostridia bacterium]